jgi:hypothetical protein
MLIVCLVGTSYVQAAGIKTQLKVVPADITKGGTIALAVTITTPADRVFSTPKLWLSCDGKPVGTPIAVNIGKGETKEVALGSYMIPSGAAASMAFRANYTDAAGASHLLCGWRFTETCAYQYDAFIERQFAKSGPGTPTLGKTGPITPPAEREVIYPRKDYHNAAKDPLVTKEEELTPGPVNPPPSGASPLSGK